MWQAEHVQACLQAQNPDRDVRILGMTTRGDQILDRPLAAIGGKGLFIKELEVAMAEGRADQAGGGAAHQNGASGAAWVQQGAGRVVHGSQRVR